VVIGAVEDEYGESVQSESIRRPKPTAGFARPPTWPPRRPVSAPRPAARTSRACSPGAGAERRPDAWAPEPPPC